MSNHEESSSSVDPSEQEPIPSTTTTTTTTAPPPLPLDRLAQLAQDACTTTLQDVTAYDHEQCRSWNESITSAVLRNLVEESPKGVYKFVINTTIVQQPDGGSGGAGTATSTTGNAEDGSKRGMLSATGGYWNVERDGMWSWKFDGVKRGMGLDVVVSVIWIAVA